ncbi:serine hydrolase domain-containing protein [Streptomyces sp. LN699]|uniref:serine hydrolase domain-containing protein n=1 Tax=Streptomyces sp. LN699 TaxID=3112981 RepID=UPI00371BB136
MRPLHTPSRSAARPRPRGLRRAAVAALAATALAGSLTPAAAGTGPDEPPRDRSLQRQLLALVEAPGGPPGAIAVLRRDGRQEVYRAGVAEIGRREAPGLDDHMRIASVAKAFSGAVALSLVDDHRLGLDDTIGRRLPRLPRDWHAVTLRQLLNHTSGLPDYTEDPEFLEILTADPRHRFDSRRLLDYVADEDLRFEPGSRYQYSNSDNIAVALMAEQATGRRYEELLKERVYRPLGLRATSLPQGYRLPEPFMHGYAVEPPAPPEDVSEVLGASGVWASGGIVSTPRELSAFIRGYAGPELLSPPTRRQQQRFVRGGASEPAGPGANAAGLGIFRYTTRCGVVLGHTGNFPGYTQFAAATPDGKRSVTVSVTSQVPLDPELLDRLRATEENFVCRLLGDH